MNQEKIGKFISECRKNRKMTQSELAEKLGISDKSVSKWETGKCMPDLSLFKPLCEELEITINELLSGEKIDKKDYQNKLEENIVNIVNYSDKKSDVIGYFIFTFIGFISFVIGISFHSTDNMFPILFELFGISIILFGFNKLLVNVKKITRIIISIIIFVILFGFIETIDISSVGDVPPKYYYSKEKIGECTIYKKICNKNIIYKNKKFDSQGNYDEIKKYCNKN